MTRTVFDNDTVAHVWAQNNQDSGRSHNGQFYFDGPALYSYGSHYLAGYILPNGTALINADSNSPTTNRHVSRARSAVSHRTRVEVPGLTELRQVLAGITANGVQPHHKNRLTAWALDTYGARLSYGSLVKGAPINSLAPLFTALGLIRSVNPLIKKIEAKNRKAERQAEKNENEQKARDVARWMWRTESDIEKALRVALGQTWGEPLDELESLSRELYRLIKWAQGRKGMARKVKTLKAQRAQILAAKRLELARRERAQARMGAIRGARAIRDGLAIMAGKAPTLDTGRNNAFGYDRGAWGPDGDALGPDGEPNAESDRINSRERALFLIYQGAAQVLEGAPMSTTSRKAIEALKTSVAIDSHRAQQTREKRKADKAERLARERLEAEREKRESWLAGGTVRFYGRDAQGGAYLRAVGVERDESGQITGGTLQTSQGADVPLTHALRVFRFLKHCKETGTPWARNGRTIRVGHYQVDKVAPDGSFVAGCHVINWPQVEAVALALGVADLAPDSGVAQ